MNPSLSQLLRADPVKEVGHVQEHGYDSLLECLMVFCHERPFQCACILSQAQLAAMGAHSGSRFAILWCRGSGCGTKDGARWQPGLWGIMGRSISLDFSKRAISEVLAGDHGLFLNLMKGSFKSFIVGKGEARRKSNPTPSSPLEP